MSTKNRFDQVLLRPELAERFQHQDLTVLSKIGEKSLLAPNGRPDSKTGTRRMLNGLLIQVKESAPVD